MVVVRDESTCLHNIPLGQERDAKIAPGFLLIAKTYWAQIFVPMNVQFINSTLFEDCPPPISQNERSRPPNLPRLAWYRALPPPHLRHDRPQQTPPRLPQSQQPRRRQKTTQDQRYVVDECFRFLAQGPRYKQRWASGADGDDWAVGYGC